MATYSFTIPDDLVESFRITRKSDATGPLFEARLYHRFGASRDSHGSILNPAPAGIGYGTSPEDAVGHALESLADAVLAASRDQSERPRPSLPKALASKEIADLSELLGL